MRHTSNALGRHLPGNGEGLTVQDLYEALRIMTFAERRNSYITCGPFDVIGLNIGQRDQAERSELSVSILLDGGKEWILYDEPLAAPQAVPEEQHGPGIQPH